MRTHVCTHIRAHARARAHKGDTRIDIYKHAQKGDFGLKSNVKRANCVFPFILSPIYCVNAKKSEI